MPKDLKIYFTSDIHGSEKCFRKFLNAAKYYKADVIILGGDITGKMLIPVVKRGAGRYVTHFHGNTIELEGDAELEEIQKQIRWAGFYPYVCEQDEVDFLASSEESKDELFNKLMMQSVGDWLTLAESRLREAGIPCYMSPGNDDILQLDPILQASDYIICPDNRIVDLEGYEMLSYGYVNETPWDSAREMSDEELGQHIQEMAKGLRNPERAIFNLHAPPYNTGLDVAPMLDKNFKPVVAGGEIQTAPVGSRSVRQLIEQYQPLLALHGHIHESRASTRIGRSLSLNPGSEYGEGILHGAVVTLTPKGAKNHLLVIN